MAKIEKLFSFGFVVLEVFILMWSLALIFFGYNRVKMAIALLEDPYPLHFANVGLMYLSVGIPLLILFFVLIILKVYKSKK